MQENTPATKKDIETLQQSTNERFNELQQATQKSIDDLVEVIKSSFAYTHEEIHRLDGKIDTVYTKLDIKINTVFTKLDTKIDGEAGSVRTELQEVKTEVLSGNEQIAKQLDDIKQEQVAATGARRRIDDTLDNHEERIGKLEEVRV